MPNQVLHGDGAALGAWSSRERPCGLEHSCATRQRQTVTQERLDEIAARQTHSHLYACESRNPEASADAAFHNPHRWNAVFAGMKGNACVLQRQYPPMPGIPFTARFGASAPLMRHVEVPAGGVGPSLHQHPVSLMGGWSKKKPPAKATFRHPGSVLIAEMGVFMA